ncbi:hypothetical protein CPB83DRAFT_205178 [Crepidotus variabilis]|uniref:Uncharacterized protein n=1 Tax=Crepidotus variabilis TaxID=179855 RepID=A0A9P6ER85_9AGAR|nr:hypothetical protein CPB83DRAFT_205178 [Crepidotus variabilis]
MATYSITINIEHDALASLAKGGLLLCMAQGFTTGGSPIYNTIAVASEVAPIAVIKWTAVYSMYATKQTSNANPKIKTSPLPITFGQGYILPSWIDPSVGTTPDAPSNGFAFINKILASAAVAIYDTSGFSLPIHSFQGQR